ncbi:MAG: hypothetical protein LQ343_006206 [Gyalolechia ehrenbergii]|nr:MAG: hypothetical protein LQ343_006206 [Gyalolechia ehrenbergii]
MAGPKYHELCPGTCVNIILKTDQRTGKLTSGRIAGILTKGDHPRGIKVRLTDGQIGRVQSLSLQEAPILTNQASPEISPEHSPLSHRPQTSPRKNSRPATNHERPEIHSDSPKPTSLGDYITPSSLHRTAPKSAITDTQSRFEMAYPNLDSALIAAIVADYPDSAEAAKILDSLSAS